MTHFSIPDKYQRLNVTLACQILRKNRSRFYKDYLNNGKVSKHIGEDGKPYIELSELMRVFGEKVVLDGIINLEKKHTSNSAQNRDRAHTETQEKTDTRHGENIENIKLEGEIALLEQKLEQQEEKAKELKETIREKDQLLDAERNRSDKIYTDLQTHMRLLEDSRAKAQEKKSGFWSRLFGR